MARMYSRRPPEDRFWEKVDKREDAVCWDWTGALKANGYGQMLIHRDGRYCKVHVHRFAYELLVGPIPEGLDLDHLCRNRKCVNPAHLEPVTRRENILRGQHRNILSHHANTCKHGHSLLDAYVGKNGNRTCRTCMCAHQRRYYHARRKRAS